MYRALSSAKHNVRVRANFSVKAVRQFSNTPTRSAEAPSSSTQTPSKQPRFFRRLIIYTVSLVAGFYASGPLAAFNNERFYDFFYESAPFGAALLDYAESRDWDRTLAIPYFQARKQQDSKNPEVNATDKSKSGDASALTDQAKAKAPSNQAQKVEQPSGQDKGAKEKNPSATAKKTQETKEKIQKAAANAKAAVIEKQESVAEVKKKVSDAAVKDNAKKASSDIKSTAGPVTGVATVQPLPAQFHDELAKLVDEAESALRSKTSQSTAPPAPTADASKEDGHHADKPAQESSKQTTECPLYPSLPVGFEPPPGFARPKPPANSAPIGLLRYPPQAEGKSETLPQLSSSIKEISVSEPIINHIASTIDELASLLKGSPYTSAEAREVLDNAKNDLVKLVERVEKVREEERTKLEAQMDEQAREYSLKMLESDLEAQDKLVQQEADFKDFFEEEKQKFLKHYREKLDNELKVQSELIDERLRQELIAQGIELQRQWVRDLKIHVERERGGRLTKLDEMAANLKRLERITLDNAEYLDENLRIHTLWSALRALTSALESPSRRPFREELRALRHIPAAQNDPLISSALESIEATDIPDIGIDPFSDLATWFTTSVYPHVSRVALVPEQNAGLLSHLTSNFISYLQFRRQGLVEGDDVLSVLARAEYRLNEQDLDGAARELNQLKGTSRLLLNDWLEAVRRRLEVLQAIEVIRTQATLASLLVV